MKGGGGFLRLSELSTRTTFHGADSTAFRTRSAASPEARRGSEPSNLSFSPSKETSRAVKGGGASPSSEASSVQYSIGLEPLDLPLALRDDPQRDRLDPAGRQPAPDLLPQKVGHLVTDEAIDDAPRLLCVHEPGVDLSRVRHRREHGAARDLVEPHALEYGGITRRAGRPQGLLQVPGDGFPLAVRVRRQVDGRGPPGRFLQLRERLLFTLEDLIGGLVGIGAVDPQSLPRQVPDVSVRSEHTKVLPEKLLERFRLRGRLHDHDRFGHKGRCTVPQRGTKRN